MINQSYYPGMLNTDIEFFNSGEATYFMTEGSVRPFNEITTELFQLLENEINKDFEIQDYLQTKFPNNPLRQLEEFTKCRFGGLDFSADIDHAGKIQKGEYWDCPLRGNCKGEGKLCKHIKFNNHIINSDEIKLIQLLITGITNKNISEKLEIPFGTIHYKKQRLYEKLEITTKQELTLFAVRFNLAQPIN